MHPRILNLLLLSFSVLAASGCADRTGVAVDFAFLDTASVQWRSGDEHSSDCDGDDDSSGEHEGSSDDDRSSSSDDDHSSSSDDGVDAGSPGDIDGGIGPKPVDGGIGPKPVDGGIGPKPLLVESVHMTVEELEVVADAVADRQRPLRRSIEVVDGRSSTLFLELEPATYDHLQLNLRTDWPLAAVSIRGAVHGVTFVYRDDRPLDLDLVSASGIVVREDEVSDVVVRFDAERWFRDVDLDGLRVSDDGVIYLDDDDNRPARNAIRKQIRASMSSSSAD